MHSVLKISACLDLLPTGGRIVARPTESDPFVIHDRTGQIIGYATMRVDVCPLTKTILGLELSSDRRPTSRLKAVAAPGRARKGKSALRKANTWPLRGMPRTVEINSPEFDAPTFRDAVMKLDEAEPDPEG